MHTYSQEASILSGTCGTPFDFIILLSLTFKPIRIVTERTDINENMDA